MAAPVAPTLATLTAEAIQKAGFTSTSSTQYSTILTRAQDYWMEEIKNDIYLMEQQLVSLQTSYVHITTEGLSKYSLPTDYGINLSMTLMEGTSTGTFQTGSTTTSWILDADDTSTEATLLGKEILCYSGTGIRQVGQVTNYDTATFTATVSGCTVAPVLNDLYVIIDNYYELTPIQVWEYEQMSNQKTTGTPNRFSLIGDDDNGEFFIYPVPYISSGVPWGIRQRYYADLMRLDLAGATMTQIYRRWRNLFIQGVYAKCLQFKSDDRASEAFNTYGNLLSMTLGAERYLAGSPADLQFSPQFRG